MSGNISTFQRMTLGSMLMVLVSTGYGKPPTSIDDGCLSNVEIVRLAKAWLPTIQVKEASVSLTDVKNVINAVGSCITTETATAALETYTESFSTPVQNTLPVISGTPSTLAYEGMSYFFTPDVVDEDGDGLSFSINYTPGWAQFDSMNGTLFGTPGFDDAGLYSNLVISVSDGTGTVSLNSFSIEVINVNRVPEIVGDPILNVTVGAVYQFVPHAFDPDGDPLVFEIQQKPDWADFNPQTGELSGTPTVTGTYTGIVISVSDGFEKVSLSDIDIMVEPDVLVVGSASLSWQIPSTRTDGSPLTLSDIGGYRVYQGESENSVEMIQDLDGSSSTSFEVMNLTAGTHYFRVTAYDVDGNESDYSNPVRKDI